MYLAAMPAMSASLHASAAVVQLTLTGFLIGVALGQLSIGTISDGTGRRVFLVTGTAAFALLSLAAAAAPNGPLLVAVRVAQGAAAAAGVVCGRAVIADHYSGPAMAPRLALVTVAGLIGPVVAPMFGGLILSHASWRAVFLALAGIGLLMATGVLLRVPETLPPWQRNSRTLTATLRRMSGLLHLPPFRSHLATSCCAMAGFFTYIAGSSFVLEHAYHIGESTYSVVFATNALAMITTTAAFAVLVRRVPALRLRNIGLCVTTISCAAFVIVAFLGVRQLVWAWLPLAGLTTGMGLMLPASITLVQTAGRAFAGTASALQGGLQFLCGALVSPLTGLLGTATAIPMALEMMAFMACSVATAVRRNRRDPSG
jgi:DHA1 family bicyclomycin/chloramphenicol resistance-like MFS transporter